MSRGKTGFRIQGTEIRFASDLYRELADLCVGILFKVMMNERKKLIFLDVCYRVAQLLAPRSEGSVRERSLASREGNLVKVSRRKAINCKNISKIERLTSL